MSRASHPPAADHGWRARFRAAAREALTAPHGHGHPVVRSRTRESVRQAIGRAEFDAFMAGQYRQPLKDAARAQLGDSRPARAGFWLRYELARRPTRITYSDANGGRLLSRMPGNDEVIIRVAGDRPHFYWLPAQGLPPAVRERYSSVGGPVLNKDGSVGGGVTGKVYPGVNLTEHGGGEDFVAVKIIDAAPKNAFDRRLGENGRAMWTGIGESTAVIPRHGLSLTPDKAYLVGQLARWGSLHTVINELHARLARDPDTRAAMIHALASRILAAVRAFHALGYRHRDIKPENLVLSRDGSVRLVDLDVCVTDADDGEFMSGVRVGTDHYIQPFYATGNTATSGDVYSTGAVLYALAQGHEHGLPPAGFPAEVIEDLPTDELDRCAARMMAARPEQRPTLEAVAEMDYFRRKPMTDAEFTTRLAEVLLPPQQEGGPASAAN